MSSIQHESIMACLIGIHLNQFVKYSATLAQTLIS